MSIGFLGNDGGETTGTMGWSGWIVPGLTLIGLTGLVAWMTPGFTCRWVGLTTGRGFAVAPGASAAIPMAVSAVSANRAERLSMTVSLRGFCEDWWIWTLVV